ncbi:hypothetical protein PSACC_01726 [Paramicrosporidium saccamoebae]|uniref:Uncharacterized protein n=1 Tax=Paramicrosporidium saccamoebae TaxID=1246581 RepID=A0A2H9TL15_9FUNG|nr:hypothetical protein PSACC_01726 [Paramicrosporidium saccamoebae]
MAITCRDETEKDKKVLHIERLRWYGGLYECTVRIEDYLTIVKGEVYKSDAFENDRRFLLDMHPVVVGADSIVANTLLERKLSGYVEFRPVDSHGIISNSLPRILPRSKEEVMLDPQFSLLEKRQIMKAISNGGSLEGVSTQVANLIRYGVCGLEGIHDVGNVKDSVQRYSNGLQRFGGKTALLYPYGGSSSLVQAICRASALKGAVQMLNQCDLVLGGDSVKGSFDGVAWSVPVTRIIESPPVTPKYTRATLILSDGGLFGDNGCNFWIDPPSDTKPTLFLLQVDAASGCCPPGQLILYAWSLGLDMELLKSRLQVFVNIPYPDRHEKSPTAVDCSFASFHFGV